jgi:hypothetical protein
LKRHPRRVTKHSGPVPEGSLPFCELNHQKSCLYEKNRLYASSMRYLLYHWSQRIPSDVWPQQQSLNQPGG